MHIARSIDELLTARATLDGTLAFVPTMGFLHDGHLSLMREGLQRADRLAVSIFVNPTQFGPGEDLEAYPRDTEGDLQKCRDVGADLVFLPSKDEIYPPNHATIVNIEGLDQFLCGASRPGHFQGVCTIVSTLFNLIRPDVAIFGQKDFQQLAILGRMTRDLRFPVEIVGHPTRREDDGLAMSSRNRYLDARQRALAPELSRALLDAHAAFQRGDRDAATILADARARFEKHPQQMRVDYIELVDDQELQRLNAEDPLPESGVLLALAVQVGPSRLIDNLRLDRPLPSQLAQLAEQRT